MPKDPYEGKYVIGDRPSHEHIDSEGKSWFCNSPYCEVIRGVDPPDNGGPPIVHIGHEPWRGR